MQALSVEWKRRDKEREVLVKKKVHILPLVSFSSIFDVMFLKQKREFAIYMLFTCKIFFFIP